QRAAQRRLRAEPAKRELEDRRPLLGSESLALELTSEPRPRPDLAPSGEFHRADVLHPDHAILAERDEAAVPAVRRPLSPSGPVEVDERIVLQVVGPG